MQRSDRDSFPTPPFLLVHHHHRRPLTPPPQPTSLPPPPAQLDTDGLPLVGSTVEYGDPLACIVNLATMTARYEKHKESEPAVVEQVTVVAPEAAARADANGSGLQCARVKLRFNRNPIVGDKFSSRHGQKGVLSVLWPQADMPFTESGMSPDVIINPHAFPSRMTIGMLIESMAGKAGALHGHYQDSTPFQFNEDRKAVDHFGEQLRAAGYNYTGSEPVYSGLTGEIMHADIYIGLVYYQVRAGLLLACRLLAAGLLLACCLLAACLLLACCLLLAYLLLACCWLAAAAAAVIVGMISTLQCFVRKRL